MSTIQSAGVRGTVEACRPSEGTPVCIDAETLSSTAPGHLRELKHELAEKDLVPAELAVRVRFDGDSSLATNEEAERVREHVRAASFLGAGTVRVDVETVADDASVESALRACAERARREGVVLDVDGPVDLD